MISAPLLVGRWPSPGGVVDIAALKRRLEDAVAPPGSVLLATCQRVELYLESPQPMPLVAFASLLGVSSEWLTAEAQVEQRHRTAAVEHLVRVASGLESAVLGEDQVLAQVRAAYSTACAHRTPGPLLHRLFHAALRTGKRVRHETGIARGNTSLAGAAVSALKRRLDGARGRSVLLVGAGEMNQIAADGLAKAGVKRLLITSRSIESARQLADRHGGEALPWSWRGEALAGVDACITATGAPHAVLDTASVRRAVMSREATAPLVIVDLAVPADVEAGARCGASLLYDDVESLAAAMRRDHDLRLQEVAHAEAIVAEECQRYLEWLDRRAADGRPARRLRA